MTGPAVARMIAAMGHAWPGRLENLSDETVRYWMQQLDRYTDKEVRCGYSDLINDGSRSPQHPPSLPELIQYTRRCRVYLNNRDIDAIHERTAL